VTAHRASLAAGVGLGWRAGTALAVAEQAARGTLAFTEVIAESIDPRRPPRALMQLVERGVAVIPHGVSLSLGGACALDEARLAHLAAVARVLRAPLVSEHVAFVRAGGLEAGHLLPVPRTRAALYALIDHVRRAQDALPVPLALENIAAPLAWPGAHAEADFLAELCARAGAGLLLDLANLHANARNHGHDARAALDRMPLESIAYVHVAGGVQRGGFWRDTHAHAVAPAVLALVKALSARTGPLPVLLERDHDLPARADLHAECAAIAAAVAGGASERSRHHAAPYAPIGPGHPAAILDERRALERAQIALVRALVAGGAAPPDLDSAQLTETAAILASKRQHA